MKYRKVNFTPDGNHTAIYCNGELITYTSIAQEENPEITPFHIEMWIDGLLWGVEDSNKMDWKTVACTDENLNEQVQKGIRPPSLYSDVLHT